MRSKDYILFNTGWQGEAHNSFSAKNLEKQYIDERSMASKFSHG